MATNNNVLNVQFLRNQTPLATREAALGALETAKADALDGSALLARYTDEGVVKTLVGYVYVSGETHDITIFDIEGASEEVEELRQEILDILGGGVSSANTVTNQLTILSGGTFTPGTSNSADTSVEGAKAYAYDLVGTLDGSVSAETGYYVKSVTEVDGKIQGTTEALPTVADSASAKTFVTSVSENLGEISVSKGSITSSGKTIVLSDNEDGGVNFEANVDGITIIVNENTGVMSVANSALIRYEGDEKTATISAVEDGVRTVSTLLTLSSVTPSSEVVKEEYALKNASGETIGETIKIYKDSHIVSIDYIDDPDDPNYQKLEYVYVNDSGATSTTYVDMSELVLEAEFASGVTVTNHVAHGVVDPISEADSNDVSFLTVGTNGFKVDGIKDEIAAQLHDVVADLDANVSGNSTHVTVGVEEVDGVISAVTVSEDNIANADDLAELSGKTVTAITSTNGSISAVIDEAIGNKSYDIETDASKIKMSGFSADTSGFTGITQDSSITDAVKQIETEVLANEETTSEALNDLNSRLNTVSGDVETISGKVETLTANSISAITVNGSGVTVANGTAPLVIEAATSAMTSNNSAIVVDTDENGNITLGLATIDCGFYA